MITQLKFKFAVSKSIWAGVLLLLIGLVEGGCLSKPALRTQMFAFQSPPPAETAPSFGKAIAVRFVTVSPLFDKNSFIYRTGAETYEIDHYASFMAAPDQSIAIAMRTCLLNSGHFRMVIEPGSSMKADEFIEAHVSELYGDFSQPGKGVAVLSMKISMFDGNGLLLQKDYTRRIPLQTNTAADVMGGWNTALNEIMTEFISGLPHGRLAH